MKTKTIILTVLCEYCGTSLTYKSIEGKQKGSMSGHYHAVCKKAIKDEGKHTHPTIILLA